MGDSHADVLKGILGEEVAAAGGTLRLMVANEPLGPTLPPEAALAEAAANGATVIVLHSTVEHFNLAAIRALAVQAQRSGISVAVVEPAPPPGFHVPERIYSLLQAGQPVRPTRTLADYRRDFGAIMAGLEALARGMPNVRIYQPQNALCTPGCALEDEQGHPLYTDSGHLSQTGVRLLRPMFRDLARVPHA